MRRTVCYQFTLQDQCMVQLLLPADLQAGEADQVCSLTRSLVVPWRIGNLAATIEYESWQTPGAKT